MSVPTSAVPRSSIPITDRQGPVKWPSLVAFAAVFLIGMLCEHGTQLLLWPLYFSDSTRPYYERGVAYTKLAFGRNLCLISQLFAPSTLVVSFADDSGRYLDPENFVTRAQSPYGAGAAGVKGGKVTGLNLPGRAVVIANHQIYLDWLYIWILAYYANLADSIHILLKNSYKWTPIIGPAMQFYRFIFIKRKWDEDQKNLSEQLAILTAQAKAHESGQMNASAAQSGPHKLLLSIFPEGTLVSENSRPGSKKYADKIGQPDFRNMVVPRSTGLLYCLRTLASEIADLKLIDLTIGFPGVPPAGTGQKHYTLRSVYMDGVPPPQVHVHIVISRISSFIANGTDSPPLGKLPKSARDSPQLLPTEEEKQAFETWLLNRWRKKDDKLEQFYKDGDFVGGAFAQSEAAGEYRRPQVVRLESAPNGKAPAKVSKDDTTGGSGSMKWVELPMELQSPLEIGHVFCWFAPVVAIYLLRKVIGVFTG
ncbi:hypothetical protein CF326_g4899 [Tilletia indica]|nr:hypothetical protein CF326_g4899 [Tilletia indica]